MAQGAANFTIQLNSSTAVKGIAEHYVMPLEPPIAVPYLAKPRAQLEALSFSNSFTNVDATNLKNNIVKLAWYSYSIGSTEEGSWQTTELTVDDGFYDLPKLEVTLAKKIKAASTGSVMGTDLWTTMDTLCAGNAGYNGTDPTETNTVTFNTRGTIVTGNGTGSSLMAESTLAHGKLILPVVSASLDLRRSKQDGTAVPYTQAPKWLIGSTLKAAVHGATNALPDMNLVAGYHVVAVHKLVADPGLPGAGGANIALDAAYGLELSPKGDAVTSTIDVGGADDVTVTISLEPPGGRQANFRGYAVKGLAHPSLKADSGWGGALDVHDIETVLETAGAAANSVVVGDTAASAGVEQYDRYIKPVTFDVDSATNKLRCYFGWPGVYVMQGSTLFTNMLGYSDDNLVSATPTPAQTANQNPFCNDTLATVAAVADRTANVSTAEILITRVRSLQFNCPSLVPASYGTDGKMSQSQMASVPVLVGPTQIQSYQAGHDDSVPCDLHGAYISEIEFYLTDQSGSAINLQNSTFQATLRIYYPDPIHPRIGEAGAELDDTVGLKDVTFRY
jgi:hypothetical protein